MGTATTVSVVDSQKHYIGGMILPGIQISLDALTARASQLGGISIEAPRRVIGKNTVECMKSGILYSSAASIDGIIDRMEEELGQKATVIATGDLPKKIVPHCRQQVILDEDLLLKGSHGHLRKESGNCLTFSRCQIIIRNRIWKKKSIFRKKGGSPSQVRYCNSQILSAFGFEMTCGNRVILSTYAGRVLLSQSSLFFFYGCF